MTGDRYNYGTTLAASETGKQALQTSPQPAGERPLRQELPAVRVAVSALTEVDQRAEREVLILERSQ